MWLQRLRDRLGSSAATPDWQRQFADLAGRTRHPALQAFYAAGTVAATTPLPEVSFAALDLETTGLSADRSSIVSIGVVPFDLRRIRCPQSRYWVVRPRRDLAATSVTIHGITHDEVLAAPDLADIADDLLAALTGRVAVVHYRAIERQFLHRAFRQRFGEGLAFPVVDTLELEARFHRHRRARMLATMLGRAPASLRLDASRRRYRLPRYSAHHALTDALATAELFLAQVGYRFAPDTPVGDLWH